MNIVCPKCKNMMELIFELTGICYPVFPKISEDTYVCHRCKLKKKVLRLNNFIKGDIDTENYELTKD